jgi:hypothetical protein
MPNSSNWESSHGPDSHCRGRLDLRRFFVKKSGRTHRAQVDVQIALPGSFQAHRRKCPFGYLRFYGGQYESRHTPVRLYALVLTGADPIQ